jgi:hypothetical protein
MVKVPRHRAATAHAEFVMRASWHRESVRHPSKGRTGATRPPGSDAETPRGKQGDVRRDAVLPALAGVNLLHHIMERRAPSSTGAA